ncbi:MAG: hypothetical protein ACU836_06095 [Gammaproteobacteria bacterium]
MCYLRFFHVIIMASLLGKTALAAELTEVPFDSMPDAVKATLLTLVDKAHVSKISKISDDNSLRFEIEADKTDNQKPVVALDIVIADNGKIMKLAREVPYFVLSYPLMQTIENRYPGIKVSEVESIETHFFDVTAELDGQAIKFRLQENGQIQELNTP